MAFLSTTNEMENEHEAWLRFVEEFRKVLPGANMNDPKWTPMVRAIEFWGEELVALRLKQTPEDREAAHEYKRSLLNP